MACPIQVARKAPAMPSTVVRMKPLGLFGPGESSRAMIPATKPTMMTQMMPLMTVTPFLNEIVCLMPTFRSSCYIAVPTFTNFGKSWALAKILILVVRF